MVARVLEREEGKTSIGCGRKFRKDSQPAMYHDRFAETRARELATSIEDAGFSLETLHQLRNRRMAYLIDIACMSVQQYETSGYTKKAIAEIKRVLARHRLESGMRFSTEAHERIGEEMKRMQKASLRKSDAYIRLKKDGTIETNLSPEALRTIVRIAKKELEELREDLKPHRIKVIGEFIDLLAEK